MLVGLFIPCFVDALYPQVGVATVRLLEHLGLRVECPPEQTCCGQPQFNAGHTDQARLLAERFCSLFESYDLIACPSGSCTSMVRNHYPSLVGQHPVCSRVFELSELLVHKLGLRQLGARLEGRAAVHIGCHARRELQVADAVLDLLGAVEGLQLVTTESDTWCCGFGGTFSIKFPEVSTAMAERRLQPILKADVDYLISTDSSCILQLAGLLSRKHLTRPRPMHLAEVLATCVQEQP